MLDRRRAPRHLVDSEIIDLNGKPATGSRLLNLSEKGAALETPMALSPGDEVELNFIFSGEKQATRRKGRVVWAQHFPYGECCLLGLEFSDHIPS